MNRRELLQTALAGSAGVALIGLHRACLANADLDSAIRHPFMTEQQRKLTVAVAERIIPETDTAGAIRAKVPEFIELMLSDWYTPEERKPFIDGAEQLDVACEQQYGKPFPGCSEEQQVEELKEIQESVFFKLLKNLTVYGYYTSEIGVQAELRFNPAPGRYTTIDFDEVGRQWAS